MTHIRLTGNAIHIDDARIDGAAIEADSVRIDPPRSDDIGRVHLTLFYDKLTVEPEAERELKNNATIVPNSNYHVTTYNASQTLDELAKSQARQMLRTRGL